MRTKGGRPVSLSTILIDSERVYFVYISTEMEAESLMNVPYLFN